MQNIPILKIYSVDINAFFYKYLNVFIKYIVIGKIAKVKIFEKYVENVLSLFIQNIIKILIFGYFLEDLLDQIELFDFNCIYNGFGAVVVVK